jgi:signal transduction histidine kinase
MFDELSLHILDIAMNSIAAQAHTIEIGVLESRRRDRLVLRVRDDGRGMDAATLDKVLRRSITTKSSRKKNIGLGLALLRQTAEMCDGHFQVQSAPEKGTRVTASMRLSHIDRPPLGDINATILALCAAGADADVRLRYRTDTDEFRFGSKELNQEQRTYA